MQEEIVMSNFNQKILLIEDNSGDVELIREMLSDIAGGYALTTADRLASGLSSLEEASFDVVLLDMGLPDSMGIETLRDIQDKAPNLPIVVLTGLSDEEFAVQAIGFGAQDYLVKGQFDGPVLSRSMRYAIERKRIETERDRLIVELKESLIQVKQLSGLLPICASCKKIRDDKGYWNQIETYISEHSEALFSHAICPECGKKLYPEYYDKIWGEEDK
jgi:DNA-binding NtrC family response regulator